MTSGVRVKPGQCDVLTSGEERARSEIFLMGQSNKASPLALATWVPLVPEGQ